MTTPYSQPSRPDDTQRRRNPRLLILLLFVVCALFVTGYMERLTRLETIRDRGIEMDRQIAASRQRNAALREEAARVQDPAYLALMARDDIGLIQEGDLPVVIYEGKPEPTPAQVQAQTAQRKPAAAAPWQQWFELLFPQTDSQ